MAQRNRADESPFQQVDKEIGSGVQFHFISIRNPGDANDRKARRLARSYAVTRGLENKRKLQQESGHNFRVVSSKDKPRRHASRKNQSQTLVASPRTLPVDAPDPFQMLAAESPKFQVLHSQLKAQQPLEPVFSISDELVLPNLGSVLRKGLNDCALLNALMLTFAFAITASSIDSEFLGYQSEALSFVRERMGSLDRAASESTLGAILLLAGIEARLGMPRQVQLHMGAIQQLLDVCRSKGVYLSDGIKRAIFWQDLNASVLTGSSRVVDHTTFSELQWRRDPFSPAFFLLPPGFQPYSHLLGEQFLDVLRDITALQCIRDSNFFGREDVISMARIDNHQASIQSRIVSLPNPSTISECCHLAAYLCSAMLRCKLWRASTIPSHLSLHLLRKLQQAHDDPIWESQPNLLTWLLHIGGAFAPTGPIRSEYMVLLQLNRSTRFETLYTSWSGLMEVLKQFIWSDKAFKAQVEEFWEEGVR